MIAIKKFLPLVIAAACGLAAVVLINNYINQKTEEEKIFQRSDGGGN